jgi:hypothetical protein
LSLWVAHPLARWHWLLMASEIHKYFHFNLHQRIRRMKPKLDVGVKQYVAIAPRDVRESAASSHRLE